MHAWQTWWAYHLQASATADGAVGDLRLARGAPGGNWRRTADAVAGVDVGTQLHEPDCHGAIPAAGGQVQGGAALAVRRLQGRARGHQRPRHRQQPAPVLQRGRLCDVQLPGNKR